MVPFDSVLLNFFERWLIFVENEIHSVVARAFTNLDDLTLFPKVLYHLVEDACAILGLCSD